MSAPTAPQWAENYIDLPYADRGRTRDGVDCYGLYALVQREVFGVQVPDYVYASAESARAVARTVKSHLNADWDKVTDPRPGDLVLLKIGGEPWHCGVYMAERLMLHASAGQLSGMEWLDDVRWEHRNLGVYRLKPEVARCVDAAAPAPVPAPAPLAPQGVPDGHCPVLFTGLASEAVRRTFMPAGQTLAQMLGSTPGESLRVFVGGYEVPRALWPQVKPKAGIEINIEFWPAGGGSARKWVLTVVAIVAAVFSYGASTGASWAAIGGLSAGTVAIGGALIAGLALSMIPPPSMGLGNASPGSGDQLHALTGTQNNINPGGVIPCVFGGKRWYPPHAAMPYTEIHGDQQYMRLMLDLGYGDCDHSDITIGGTPIEDYDNVEYEITTTPTLYTDDIFEDAVGATLAEGDSLQRTTQDGTTEISLDLIYPSGLFAVDDKGRYVSVTNHVDILFRKAGTTTWYAVIPPTPGISLSSSAIRAESSTTSPYLVTSSEAKALRVSLRWKQPAGQYEVYVKNLGYDWDASVQQSLTMQWSVLRSISPKNPSTTGTTKLCMRVNATDNQDGVLRQVSLYSIQRVRRWDRVNQVWLDPAGTMNPAWVSLWSVTQCPAVTEHLADSDLDMDEWSRWADDCDAQGATVGFVLDAARVFDDYFKSLLACGLATRNLRNGKLTVARDVRQTVAMNTYTPANNTALTWSRNFVQPPHALRVKFTNPEEDDQQDEVLVYWTGYSAANATVIETLDLSDMVNSPITAWKIGYYQLAVMWLRPNTYTIDVDIEYLRNKRGDLVNLADKLIGWGLAYGRVKNVVGNRVVLDTFLQLDPAKQYSIRIGRVQTGDEVEGSVTPIVTWDSTRITFDNDTPIDELTGPTNVFLSDALDVQPGDLFVLGEVNQLVLPALITNIQPGQDMLKRTAKLQLVDAAPGVWDALNAVPPPFVSSISGKSWCAAPDPPQINIRIGTSVPDNGGLKHNQGGFSGTPGSGIWRLPSYKLQQLGLL